MALNKYMHTRNIYKNPPDFAKMAIQYPEFSEIVIKDINGKVSVNFKDPQSLRVLTRCLLKSDFNLDVEIPEDRLVPTLPLRLNYILWIEDLLNSILRNEQVLGIDIGTGACAIYPLLAAVKNKWHMVATDSDADSLNKAKANIDFNKLNSFITVNHNETSSVIEHLLSSQETQTYDFCMCNPPFYSNMEELCESRSIARPPPKNAFTGSPQELITRGGELEFIRNLIMESRSYKNRILIYTTMVGHKYNLKELLQDLKAEGIQHTYTEFCQGRVTRWGVAWTYQDHNLYKLVPPRDKDRKKSPPIIFPLTQEDSSNNLMSVVSTLKSILSDLNISHKILNKRGTSLTLIFSAIENTWSNQRRKRRHMKRLDAEATLTNAEESKKQKLEGNMSKARADIEETNASPNCEKHAEKQTCAATEKPATNGVDKTCGDMENPANNVDKGSESKVNSTASSSSCAATERVQSESNSIIVQAFTKIFKKDTNFMLEMQFLSGTGGKESLHQIAQYIKNKWK